MTSFNRSCCISVLSDSRYKRIALGLKPETWLSYCTISCSWLSMMSDDLKCMLQRSFIQIVWITNILYYDTLLSVLDVYRLTVTVKTHRIKLEWRGKNMTWPFDWRGCPLTGLPPFFKQQRPATSRTRVNVLRIKKKTSVIGAHVVWKSWLASQWRSRWEKCFERTWLLHETKRSHSGGSCRPTMFQ